eukprot:2920206-Rhodomonas_salina.1
MPYTFCGTEIGYAGMDPEARDSNGRCDLPPLAGQLFAVWYWHAHVTYGAMRCPVLAFARDIERNTDIGT